MDEVLIYFSMKYQGDFARIMEALTKHEHCDFKQANKWREELPCKVVTILSDDYPARIRHISAPPVVLYYLGDLSLLNSECTMGIIGSRYNTSYGKTMCKKVVPELVKENVVIISGLAKGIDCIAHQTCLDCDGKTVAVLGNGIDYYYPIENMELQQIIGINGLLISEYPPNTKPEKENFPKRNRIIAGLSDSILVVEAKRKSGTMITVNEALKNGKDIMCLPNLASADSGCNELIKSGAYLVENAQDILEIAKK